MLRLAALMAVAAALLAPSGAAAQQQQPPANPFGPLPPSAPTPVPTAEPAEDPTDDDVGRTTLYAIMGGLVVVFIGVALWIARDARSRVPERHAPRTGQLREEGPHRHARQAKAKSRAKSRKARAARKRNR